jgi:hypothetical protein
MAKEKRGLAYALMNEEQRAQSAHLEVMRQIVKMLMDSEERKQRGMKRDEIVVQFNSDTINAIKALEDLIVLRYVVCTTETDEEETSGDVHIKTLSELCATTFFGRKWLLEEQKV